MTTRGTAAATATTGTAAAATATGTARRAEAGQAVQLKVEQLHAAKQPVQTGEVKVRKEVVTEHKTMDVPVERAEVVIERRPVRREAAAGDIRAEEVRVPVRGERVDVRKEAVVTGEVSVGKRKVQSSRRVGGHVRKERLKVEREGDVNVRGQGKGK
jgi:uncharacterized protein (TIGR02271 family)